MKEQLKISKPDQESESRVLHILRDNAVVFVIGLSLSLLLAIPDLWLSPIQKFWTALILLIVALITILGRAFYSDFHYYCVLKEEIKDYYELIPRIVRFSHHNRTFQLQENGDANKTYQIMVQNLSSTPITQIKIPTWCDVYESDGETSKIKIKALQIGTHEVSDSQARCYHKEGILNLPDGSKKEHGLFVIPLIDIGGLRDQPIEIKINVKVIGAFEKMMTGEYALMDIYHPTDEFKMVIISPDGFRILLDPSKTFPKSVEVYEVSSEVIDHRETNNVSEPRITDNRIEWFVAKPKIGYRYRVNFKIFQETKEGRKEKIHSTPHF